MQFIDKYNIIENHTINNANNSEYIEKYINSIFSSSDKIIVSNYINQLLWFKTFNNENMIELINSLIKKYLTNQKKIFKTDIKNKEFKFDKYIAYLLNYKKKLVNIQELFFNNMNKSEETKYYKHNLVELSKTIISDPIILIEFEKIISSFDLKYKDYIEQLYDICIKISIYDKNKIVNKILLTISDCINRYNILDLSENKKLIELMPDNLKNIIILKVYIDHFNKLKKYYDFMNNDNINIILIDSIYNKIFNIVMNIILHNSENIIYIFDNLEQLYDIIIYNNDIHLLCNELVNIINKLNKDNFDSIKTIKLLNIINILYQKMNDIKSSSMKSNADNLNVLFVKIFMILSNNIYNILTTIDMLIKDSINNKDIIDTNINIIKEFINVFYNKGIVYNSDQQNQKLHIDYYQQFIDIYYELLIKRIINFINLNDNYIKIESAIIKELNKKFSKKMLYKINLILNDINNMTFNNNPNLFVITGSYEAWPINYTNGIITIDMLQETLLGKYMIDYEKELVSRKDANIKLNWYLHYGEVNITYLETEFKLLPIQFLILEIISKELLQQEDIIKLPLLSNYTKEYINNIIQSLLVSRLVKKISDLLVLNNNISEIYESNIVDIFFNNLSYKEVEKEFVHSKIDIINATINHYLKRSSLTKDVLFDKIKNDITLFNVNTKDYEKSLEYMIKMDYIRQNNNEYEKLLY